MKKQLNKKYTTNNRRTVTNKPVKKAARSSAPIEDSDADSDKDLGDIVPLDYPRDDNGSDDDLEEEVFNLGRDDEEDENSAGSSQEDEEDTEDDDDDDLSNLVKNLAPELRQKIISGNVNYDNNDDLIDDEEEPQEVTWGKKKNYWSGDTADLEIGQDVQDAEDEEQAALEQRKQQLGQLEEDDFYEDFEDDNEDNSNNKLHGDPDFHPTDKLSKELYILANGEISTEPVQKLDRDISALSKKERIEMLQAESPELLNLVAELVERVQELRQKVFPLQASVNQSVTDPDLKSARSDELVQYLEVKQQLLLAYCTNMLFYLMMKAEGKSVRAHPVMKQLLSLRYIMEKMSPIDGKLKFQIDRLIKAGSESNSTTSALRPRPSDLLPRDDDGDEGYDEEEEGRGRTGKGKGDKAGDANGLYRAPRMQAMPYEDEEKSKEKQRNKLERRKNKLRNSEILDTLREEFGAMPEEASSSGTAHISRDLKDLEAQEEERRDFEEDRFVRLTLSRKEKKDVKKRQREATSLNSLSISDLGDIGEFEQLSKLSRGLDEDITAPISTSNNSKRSKKVEFQGDLDVDDGEDDDMKADNTSSALQRAVNAFAMSGDTSAGSKRKNKSGGFQSDDYEPEQVSKKFGSKLPEAEDDYDDLLDEMSGAKKAKRKDTSIRRRAPESDEQNGFSFGDELGEDDDLMLDEFAKKKTQLKSLKQQHYTPESRFGGIEEELETDDIDSKRAATYEIMANKGLTPHRKKENRNARVKKRLKYDKAVKARKGQVREVVTGMASAYGGEATGIKANVARSRKIMN